MPDIFYGTSVSNSGRGDFPELRVVNMIPETEATAESLILNSRPGIENSAYSFGTGPVKALYTIDGVLSGDLFGISGTSLYSVTGGNLGTIDGTGPGYLAGFENALFANAGAGVWKWTEAGGLVEVPVPDNSDVAALVTGASRLIIIKKDTGQFYWSDPLSDNIDALSFATAENSPDKLKDLLFLGDTVILFGSETVEFWPSSSSNPNLPFQVLPGRTYQRGIRDTGCAVRIGNTFAWVTDDNQVCLSTPEQIISTPTVESDIADSATCRVWKFTLFQTEYIAVRLDDKTHCYSTRYNQWIEFDSFNQDNWLPQCFAGRWFGSSVDGQLYQWSDDYGDFGGEVVKLITAWVALDTGFYPLFNALPRVNTGSSKTLVPDPKIEMRFSKDGGKTWSKWRERSLGEAGTYGKKISYRSLGTFRYPGGLLEFRVTDPTDFRFSGVSVNDGY